MRAAGVAASMLLSTVGVSSADSSGTSVRKQPTHIAAQALGSALKMLAQSRGLQVLYLSSTVRNIQTQGAEGEITADEAFEQLLKGTGLTYRYLDENTVTVYETEVATAPEGASVLLQKSNIDIIDTSAAALRNISADAWLMAEATPPNAAQPPAVPAPAAEEAPQLQEIIVTGSRIASPNEVSTSPIQVVSSSNSIRVSGKTDITDIISQLPQSIHQRSRPGSRQRHVGIEQTAGGVATADLRGLGPGRTLVLIDGRRLGCGFSQTRRLRSPHPDLDQVTRGPRRSRGSRHRRRLRSLRFRCHRRCRQFHHEAQLRGISRSTVKPVPTLHDNNDQIRRRAWCARPATRRPPAPALDGRNRTFDILTGNATLPTATAMSRRT
jgi:hypothetical protein